jgi:hypothetical protein
MIPEKSALVMPCCKLGTSVVEKPQNMKAIWGHDRTESDGDLRSQALITQLDEGIEERPPCMRKQTASNRYRTSALCQFVTGRACEAGTSQRGKEAP